MTPRAQHPDETEENGIDKSLKQVYASLWNFRAFTEREFHRIDHLAARRWGCWCIANYSDELANGVAVSFDPVRGNDNYYYVNSQVGEDLVTNPDALSVPEEILLRQQSRGYLVIRTSNQTTPGLLLMSRSQMHQLRQHLTAIHDHFKGLYKPAPDAPFAMEIEFKITSENVLAIKQARPWVFTGQATPSDSTRADAAPEILGNGMFTYRENGSSPLFTFRATDPEGGAIIWSISGKDEDDFTISETGVLSFANSPDYENPTDSGRDNIYEVTVMAWDDALNSAALEVTVTVTEVNEGPEISRVGNPPGNVPENYDETQVLARYRATDPEDTGAVITRWSTSGTDGGDFVMNEQGELRFRYTPDYERPADSNRDNVYTFSVRASDGRYYGYREVTVEVTPVNEPPTITTTSTSATELRQAENRTTRLYTYRATDSERAAITWSVGGTDRNHFAIDERGQFSFGETSPPDFDARSDSDNDNVYEVTVRATDDDNNTATLDVTVTVTEVNEGPEITGGTATITRPENHPQDQVLATYSGTDPESPGSPDNPVERLGNRRRRFRNERRRGVEVPVLAGLRASQPTPHWDNVYTFSVRASDGRYYGYLRSDCGGDTGQRTAHHHHHQYVRDRTETG